MSDPLDSTNTDATAPRRESVSDGSRSGPHGNLGRMIAIASGKGGVGKSTVTANLAVMLAQRGLRIGLVDADLYGPSIPGMLGIFADKPPAMTPEKR